MQTIKWVKIRSSNRHCASEHLFINDQFSSIKSTIPNLYNQCYSKSHEYIVHGEWKLETIHFAYFFYFFLCVCVCAWIGIGLELDQTLTAPHIGLEQQQVEEKPIPVLHPQSKNVNLQMGYPQATRMPMQRYKENNCFLLLPCLLV